MPFAGGDTIQLEADRSRLGSAIPAQDEVLGRVGYMDLAEREIRRLRDKNGDMRRAAAKALVAMGAPAVEPLIAALKHEVRSVRQAAAEALGHIRDTRAVEPLIAASRDMDRWVRKDAVDALGKLGDPRAVEALVVAL